MTLRHTKWLSAACAAMVISSVIAGCGSSSSSASKATSPKATTETFVDTSRTSVAGKNTPAAPSRTLVTTIVYPDIDVRSPLVVLSHGSGGSPAGLTALASAWAEAGFVVALPAFPPHQQRQRRRQCK